MAQMRWLILMLIGVGACNNVTVKGPDPAPIDYNEDGRIGFADLERGYPPQPLPDTDCALEKHLEKQNPDYPDHFR